MGIIIKQSIKGTIYSYIGVVLGFIVSAVLFPRFYSTEEIGLTKILISYSVLFANFGILGFNGVIYRLFPFFRDKEKQHNGFFFLLLLVGVAGSILMVLFFIIIQPILVSDSAENSALFVEYLYMLLPLIIFSIFFNLFDIYTSSLYHSTIGTLLKEVVLRLMIITSIGLYFFDYIDFNQFVYTYVISYCIPTIIILVILIKKGEVSLKPQFGFIDKDLRKSIIQVALFSVLTTLSGVLILNVDTIMINSMVSLAAVGIYGVTFYFGQLIKVPARSLIRISNVVIAESWKANDIVNIKDVYNKSCLNQLIIGSLLFIGVWGNIDNIFQFLPSEFEEGKWVIFFIGLGNLIDMAAGVNRSIIGTSKLYKYQTIFMLFLMVFVVVSNILFIPKWGITGAAIASALSLTITNVIRYIFVWLKFKMQPYSYKHLFIIVFAALSYYLSTLIPSMENIYVDFMLRSISLVFVFMLPIYFLKISEDINSKIKDILMKFKRR